VRLPRSKRFRKDVTERLSVVFYTIEHTMLEKT